MQSTPPRNRTTALTMIDNPAVSVAVTPPARRSVGRPRRLTLSQILDAAIDMGLDGLRIAAIAQRLGVRPAVLYTYVSGRTELVRMAAQRASGSATFPNDCGQSWRDYALQYAEAQFHLVDDGQLVSTLLHGQMSPGTKLDSAEQWVQFMVRRGFAVIDALDLLRSIDAIVLGGALLSAYARAIGGTETGYHDVLLGAVAQRSLEDLPLLGTHAEAYAASAANGWRTALATMLDAVTIAMSSSPK